MSTWHTYIIVENANALHIVYAPYIDRTYLRVYQCSLLLNASTISHILCWFFILTFARTFPSFISCRFCSLVTAAQVRTTWMNEPAIAFKSVQRALLPLLCTYTPLFIHVTKRLHSGVIYNFGVWRLWKSIQLLGNIWCVCVQTVWPFEWCSIFRL